MIRKNVNNSIREGNLDIAIDNGEPFSLALRGQIINMINALNLIPDVDVVDVQLLPTTMRESDQKRGYTMEGKYQNLIKALAALERSIDLYKNPRSQITLAEKEACTASVIKHFELFLATLWKYFKVFLLEAFGADVAGSKTIFKACVTHKLVTEEELKTLLSIVDERNATTHVYDEETARRMCDKIIT